jgi:hypothetical protein
VAGSPIIGFVRSLGSDTTRRKEKREAKKRNKNVRGDRTKKLSGRLC